MTRYSTLLQYKTPSDITLVRRFHVKHRDDEIRLGWGVLLAISLVLWGVILWGVIIASGVQLITSKEGSL